MTSSLCRKARGFSVQPRRQPRESAKGLPGPLHVPGRVLVAIQDQPAVRADRGASTQAFGSAHPTPATVLTGVLSRNRKHPMPGVCCFGFEDGPDLRPACVADGPRRLRARLPSGRADRPSAGRNPPRGTAAFPRRLAVRQGDLGDPWATPGRILESGRHRHTAPSNTCSCSAVGINWYWPVLRTVRARCCSLPHHAARLARIWHREGSPRGPRGPPGVPPHP